MWEVDRAIAPRKEIGPHSKREKISDPSGIQIHDL